VKPYCDYGLTLVTDRELCLGRSLTEVVDAAVRGGTGIVQLREKSCDSRQFYELAKALRELLRPRAIPLIINDRADIALAVEAEGLHIGQSDLPLRAAREIMGPNAIIGLSVESEADVRAAEAVAIDYFGLSPVFSTPTKTDTNTPLGLAGVGRIRPLTPLPLVAIGGISAANAAEVLAAGADGVAVVSAICSAPDPEQAARSLKKTIDQVRNRRY